MDDHSFVAIDFETATQDRGSACAVGAVVVDNWKTVDTLEQIIRPPGNEYNYFNTSIHGITSSDTETAPRFYRVWKQIREISAGRMIIAHNTAFDMSVLRHSCALREIDPGQGYFACTYRLARAAWPSMGCYRLDVLCDRFKIKLRHHNALSDANAAAKLAFRICTELGVDTVPQAAAKLGFRLGQVGTAESYLPFSNAQHRTSNRISNARRRTSNRSRSGWKLSDLISEREVDENHPLFGKNLVFTGTLDAFIRKEAVQIAGNYGAKCSTSVSKKTDYLVTGVTNLSVVRDGMSNKMRRAMSLAESGHGLEIIDEDAFLSLVYDS